ncbi:MAG: SRPBCC family protein [Chloroflexota bacterium]
MATIHKEILIDARPEAVWDAVRDVGAVHKRLTPGVLTNAHMDGDARVVTFANGLVLRELIVTIDDEARRFAYASVQGRATHHNASMQVFADGENHSRIVWITDVLPDELAQSISQLVELGSQAMKQTLESQAVGNP